jgi:hypothetical protein
VTTRKVLITMHENDVAPRFDLTTEVFVATVARGRTPSDGRTLVLAHRSAEELCQLVLDESVDVVICGGIEGEYYDYLVWKQVVVVDSVSGPWERALELFKSGALNPGDILHSRSGGDDDDRVKHE